MHLSMDGPFEVYHFVKLKDKLTNT